MTKPLNLRCLILVTLTLVVCLKSFAQSPSTASLLVRLKQSPVDTSRINIYKALVVIYRNEKSDSAIFFARQGLALASQLNYPIGAGIMHNQIGAIDITLGEIDSAKYHLKTALAIFEKANYQQGLVVAHNSLGICFAKTAGYKESAQNFLAALKINQARNDVHGLVQSYLKLGALNEQINNLDKALEYQQAALKLNTQLPPSNAESYILNNMGIIHAKKAQMKVALQCFLDAVKKATKPEPELMDLIF
jgi:tetratricopeptide (TPR) repeat protein